MRSIRLDAFEAPKARTVSTSPTARKYLIELLRQRVENVLVGLRWNFPSSSSSFGKRHTSFRRPEAGTATPTRHTDASSTQHPNQQKYRSDNFRAALLHEHVADERSVRRLENVGVHLKRAFNIETCIVDLSLSKNGEFHIECRKEQLRDFINEIRREEVDDALTGSRPAR